MQNSNKNIGKEKVEKNISVHLKMEKKRLTQLCVFGYKVGRTIFHSFSSPPNQTPKFISIFRSDKESLEKVH